MLQEGSFIFKGRISRPSHQCAMHRWWICAKVECAIAENNQFSTLLQYFPHAWNAEEYELQEEQHYQAKSEFVKNCTTAKIKKLH